MCRIWICICICFVSLLDYWSMFQYKDVIQHGQLHVEEKTGYRLFFSFNMEMHILIRQDKMASLYCNGAWCLSMDTKRRYCNRNIGHLCHVLQLGPTQICLKTQSKVQGPTSNDCLISIIYMYIILLMKYHKSCSFIWEVLMSPVTPWN